MSTFESIVQEERSALVPDQVVRPAGEMVLFNKFMWGRRDGIAGAVYGRVRLVTGDLYGLEPFQDLMRIIDRLRPAAARLPPGS